MKKLKKLKGVALICAILVFAVCMMAPTLSRYVGEMDVLYNGETDLNYTVNSVFVVTSQDELFAAINQGYTYVQLSKDIENPLIVTQQATNLEADLILDLNGIEIQRNGPEPILNIGKGVKLTVTDTSTEQTGGLYNPVGSVFNITGGTLSVVTGNFESGPRYSEYLTYNTNMLSQTDASTERTIVDPTPQLVNLTINEIVDGVVTPKEQKGVYAPIIRSYPVSTGDIIYTHGNLYCDMSISLHSDNSIELDVVKQASDKFYIERDTYLYYRTDESGTEAAMAQLNNPSDAEWFYTYYVEKDTYNYVSADKPTDFDDGGYLEITVYAYEDTILQASQISTEKDYYAAIQMQSGTLEVQTGSFYSYFGLPTTACVNASGGTIEIGMGTFSTRIPNASNSIVSIAKEDDREVFNESYFNNFEWHDNTFGTGSRAGNGLGYCILAHNEAKVDIASGQFCSTNNNIISMQGGSLEINNGTFYMKRTIEAASASKATAAVYMKSGSLDLDSCEYYIRGNYTVGIYSTVDTSIEGNKFEITDTSLTMTDGDNQYGIYSENGEVNLNHTSGANPVISIEGDSSSCIIASTKGSVVANNYDFILNGDNSVGILSTGGSVSLTGGNVTLTSNKTCYGVYASSDSDIINVSLVNMSIDVGYEGHTESKNEDCASSIGVFMASGEDGSLITLDNATVKCYELGLVLRGGSLTLKNGGTVKTRKASAIYVDGGTLTFEENSSGDAVYTVESSNTTNTTYINTYDITVPLGNGSVAYDNLHGIYVNGGSFLCYGMLDFVHTGLQNSPYVGGDLTSNNGRQYYYNGLKVRSHAVCVEGGNVVIEKCDIEAKSGGGVYCSGGNITLGNKDKIGDISTLNQLILVNTTGTYVGEKYYGAQYETASTWQNYKSLTGGHAIELNGGNINVYYGQFEAQFGNGLQVTGNDTGSGVINVYNGRFVGNMNYSTTLGGSSTTFSGQSGPAAYYGLKVVGAATVNIFNGVFDGGNGGALVTGIDAYVNTNDYSSAASSNIDAVVTRALVYVYAGEFGHAASGGKAASVDAFNIYDNATVIFGAYSETDATALFGTDATKHNDAIKLYASSAAIAFNHLGRDYAYSEYAYLYYGTYNQGSKGLFGSNTNNLKVHNYDGDANDFTLVKSTNSFDRPYPNQTVYFDKTKFNP